MSVDYRYGIVYGWRVTQKERDQMIQNCDYEYEDDFILLNAYEDSDYIFGIWLLRGDYEGYCTKIDFYSLFKKLPVNFYDESREKLRQMGCEWINDSDHKRFHPCLYLVGTVT